MRKVRPRKVNNLAKQAAGPGPRSRTLVCQMPGPEGRDPPKAGQGKAALLSVHRPHPTDTSRKPVSSGTAGIGHSAPCPQPCKALAGWPERPHHSCHPDGQEIQFPTTAARPALPRHTGVGLQSTPSLTSRPEATVALCPRCLPPGCPPPPFSDVGKWPPDQRLKVKEQDKAGGSAWAPKK